MVKSKAYFERFFEKKNPAENFKVILVFRIQAMEDFLQKSHEKFGRNPQKNFFRNLCKAFFRNSNRTQVVSGTMFRLFFSGRISEIKNAGVSKSVLEILRK